MTPTGEHMPVAAEAVPALASAWFAGRQWVCSRPIPAGERVAIVSSRLPRLLDPHGAWLHALRHTLEHVRLEEHVVIAGRGCAGAELVLHGARRLGLATLAITCPDKFDDAATAMPAHTSIALVPATRSPAATSFTSSDSVPDRDRAAVAWADVVVVLALRSNGNLHRLLRERLEAGARNVHLVDTSGLQAARARAELISLGAETMAVEPYSTGHHEPPPGLAELSLRDGTGPRDCPAISSLPASDRHEWLTHTTRACPGPWPDQPQSDYWDSLLDARPDADHSAFAALVRIVRQRRLIASSRAIRGGYGVVSLTAVSPAELPRLRVFRSHRSRWDFEPYGISIRRAWLERHGARPVTYGDESVWNRLEARDRPYFQLARSSAPDDSSRCQAIDWSVEQEWRHAGDVDLDALEYGDAMILVPSVAEAGRILEFCPWPVTVLNISHH